MATLDFSELEKNPPGESFEALVRMLGERNGLVPQWSGRGPDQGRDLFFIETQEGPLGSRSVKWLVSCKDNSISGASVGERDIGSVTDKVIQHQCQGFLLATTTTASSGLKEKLDRLDLAQGGKLQTLVWDRFSLTKMLLDHRCADILAQFFPQHAAQTRQLTLDKAREIVEAALPRFTVGALRLHLVSYQERSQQISGRAVWPHDSDQALIIDAIRSDIVMGRKITAAAEKASELHFDSFASLVDRLTRNFPHESKGFLREVAANANDPATVFNAIEVLREDGDFGLDTELELARRLDSETLQELYYDLTKEALEELSAWDRRLPSRVQQHDDHVELISVAIRDLKFSGGDAVNVEGRVELTVEGWNSNPEEPGAGRADFVVGFSGYWLADGVELEEVR